MRMLAMTGVFAVSLGLVAPAGAAHRHASDEIVYTWEQCHIKSLRLGFNPYQNAYVRHMMHCLGGKKGT